MKPETHVSCIMPTRNRRRFVSQSIVYFSRQTYPSRELIILDDGEDPVADLIPVDERIRYVRLDRRITVGAKRNLACEMARGELIAHWDDDDWMAPDRLSFQIKELEMAGAEICGFHELLCYNPAKGEAWCYRPFSDAPRFIAGGTMLYHRSLWETCRFLDKNVGEDAAFALGFDPEKIHLISNGHLYLAIHHGCNTAAVNLSDTRWERRPLSEAVLLIQKDRDFYVALRHGYPWPPSDRNAKGGQSVQSDSRTDQLRKCRTAQHAESLSDETANFHVVVSVPYYKCKATIARAVESILAQTHENLTLVVVNDADPDPPWDELAHIRDERLVRYDLPVNRGPYFSHAMVLNASDSARFFLIQDADDWSEPERIAILMNRIITKKSHAAISACRAYNGSHQPFTELYDPDRFPLTDTFIHRTTHCGLFETRALKDIGGYFAGFRIGYDTLIMNFLLMTGRVSFVRRPLYNRRVRPESLSRSPETGMQSSERAGVKRILSKMYGSAYAKYRQGGPPSNSEDLTSLIRQLVNRQISTADRTALLQETSRLSLCLSESRPSFFPHQRSE